MYFVFDLDGTLADATHRQHYVQGDKKTRNWGKFFAACDQDEPHLPVITVLMALAFVGHKVEIWSGRSDEVKDKTLAWLKKWSLEGIPIRMRPAGDYTPDQDLKRIWLIECGDDRPDMIFDDRAKVVRMWREEGVPCAQVADGDF